MRRTPKFVGLSIWEDGVIYLGWGSFWEGIWVLESEWGSNLQTFKWRWRVESWSSESGIHGAEWEVGDLNLGVVNDWFLKNSVDGEEEGMRMSQCL